MEVFWHTVIFQQSWERWYLIKKKHSTWFKKRKKKKKKKRFKFGKNEVKNSCFTLSNKITTSIFYLKLNSK